ncbi:MAG TPA: adenosyl-hopene transferase HpnH [Candidatus Brocadiia bacterium]|nr:adenosyl-hopene transferase HpnH [Candidatus Brocadiales bacterium]
MRVSARLGTSLAKYLLKNRLASREKFPLVLMLEVTHLCNLACKGCGRIWEYRETLGELMGVEECLSAVDECDAPVVSVTGGEPLMHPQIGDIVRGILDKKRHIYLCTNGLLLAESLHKLKPSPYFNINVHIDGLEETHDAITGVKGVFKRATDAIKKAKSAGFKVCTNTTIYKNTIPGEIEKLFIYLERLGVDGMLVSPGFSFEDNGNNIFLCREEIQQKFGFVYNLSKRFKVINSPLYLKFLRGERDLLCTPWGNPTKNYHGWKSPCYLITDTHYGTYRELMASTDWEKYRSGNDPRCKNCMMHSGYEATVVLEGGRKFSDILEMARWSLS